MKSKNSVACEYCWCNGGLTACINPHSPSYGYHCGEYPGTGIEYQIRNNKDPEGEEDNN